MFLLSVRKLPKSELIVKADYNYRPCPIIIVRPCPVIPTSAE